MLTNTLRVFYAILLVALFSGCSPKESAQVENISSFSNVVQAYTSSSISKLDPIFIDLRKSQIKELDAVKIQEAFSINPTVKGTINVEDEHVIVFTPSEALKSGEAYRVSLTMNDLILDKSAGSDRLYFTCNVVPQSIDIELADFRIVDKRQELVLDIELGDKELMQTLSSGLTLSQGSEELDFKLEIAGSSVFRLTARLDETNKGEQVKLIADEDVFQLNETASYTFDVPSLDEFKLAFIQDDIPNQVDFVFTEELDPTQNLNGLIKLENGKTPTLNISANKLSVFLPTSNQSQTITISRSIKTKSGEQLNVAINHSLNTVSLKPKLSAVGIGHIVPTGGKVVFPFKAQGLKSIQIEIFKIHTDNVQQFYQMNELSNYYNLEFVGEVVHEQEIALSSLSSSYNSAVEKLYVFDLFDFIQQEPNAIYEVRIGFLPADVALDCASEINYDFTSLTSSIFESGYYGVFDYYDGFNYKDRKDPCKKAFYEEGKFLRKMVLASNLGIIAKKENNKDLHVFVTNLLDAEPITGVQVEVFNKAQRSIATLQSDETGQVHFTNIDDAFMVKALKGSDVNWLRITDGDALNMSKFDVSGRAKKNGIDGFIYGERAVWRPGDSMFLDFILHDPSNKLPSDHPVTLTLENPQGAVVFNKTKTSHKGPIYSFIVPTQADYITGDYLAYVQVGSNRFPLFTKLENIKPNKFSIKSELDQIDLKGYRDQFLKNGVSLNYQVDWLYGAPAKNKKLDVEMMLRPVPVSFETFKDFKFTDPRSEWSSPPTEMLSSTTTDNSGSAKILVQYKEETLPPARLNLTLKATAYESSGDFSTDVSSTTFSPYDSYVGIDLPSNLYGDKRVGKDEKANIELVVLSDQGKPMSNRSVKVNIYRMERYWWWNSYNDKFDSRNAKAFISKDRFAIKSNAQGKLNIDPSFSEYGRYYVQACDDISGHCTGDYLYVGYVWDNGEVDASILDNSTQLNLTVEQESYKTGETVSLNIPSYFEGKALVSLENGDQVVESFWTKVERGNNKVSFTAQESMFPTIYAHVTMLQKHVDKANDMPLRLYGVAPIKITESSLELNPEISTVDSYKPKEIVSIEVSESSNKAMNYTLAIVEEGLLNLSNFQTPDPFNKLYSKPSLGVKTIDLYNDVLSEYGADITELYAIGGDAALVKTKNDVRANRFKPVVKHLGPFHLAKGSKRKHEITLPNYVGAVRIMVVAADGASYGSTEKTVSVKQDLMLLATLPRTLSPGDKLDVPVTVFSMKENMGDVSVGVDVLDDFLSLPVKNKQLRFTKPDEKIASFPAEVGTQEGVAKLNFYAKSGQLSSSQDIEIQVQNANPVSRRSTGKLLPAGETWTSELSAMSANPSEVIFSANSLAPINLENHFQSLRQYPYGCLEQRISAAFAALYQGDLMELNTSQKQRSNIMIQDLLGDLYMFRLANGYSTWPGAIYYNDYVTSYLGDFLAEAKFKGYKVPDDIWSKVEKDLTALSNNWVLNDKSKYTSERSIVYQTYRLFALAQMGKPLLNEMNRIKEDHKLSRQATIILAAAYAVAGRKDQASQLLQMNSTESNINSYDAYSNALRNHSMLTLMFNLIGDSERYAESLIALNEYLENQDYLSTNTAAFVFRALAKSQQNKKDKSVQIELDWNNSNNTLTSSTGAVFVQSDFTASKSFSITNTSTESVYVQATTVGKELLGSEGASSKNLSIKTSFLDVEGKAVDVSSVAQGTTIKVRTTIRKPADALGNFDELALRQVLPNGWEIINNRALGFGGRMPQGVEFQDFKDNQVNSFFSLENKNEVTIEIVAKATYLGSFYFPKMICEHMYSNNIFAESKGFKITVR